MRQIRVEEQKLEGVISLPSGAFKPYAGVSTAILLSTKTNSGGTDHVWFYDVAANGYDLSLNRYKEVVHEEVEHVLPKQILAAMASRWLSGAGAGGIARVGGRVIPTCPGCPPFDLAPGWRGFAACRFSPSDEGGRRELRLVFSTFRSTSARRLSKPSNRSNNVLMSASFPAWLI
ncbi:N-6 DNA methylase [Methylocaldum marinum]|uniref:N-6 DNA methylase n=1 Tax=Methylocaldum marinum TaxID=1432792 RepID=A0A250KTA1_9GAMM|nr:N-6 DNA methylase [Methylocaldum marinum]BBA34885.1 N-6 DNA methylase [Methylocaldum marinum]